MKAINNIACNQLKINHVYVRAVWQLG